MKLTDKELDKWAGYYRYFYFYEDMTFEKFIELVEAGNIPRRHIVDWSKVTRVN